MKRKLSKKVLCLCMVAVLAIGLAVPAFATAEPRSTGVFYQRLPANNTSLCLNVAHTTGDYSKLNGLAITLYTRSVNEDHLFAVATAYGNNGNYLYSKILYDGNSRTGYVLNRDSGDAHCILYDARLASPSDSSIIAQDAGNGMAYFALPDGARLTATSASKNARVYWNASLGNSSSQKWTTGN